MCDCNHYDIDHKNKVEKCNSCACDAFIPFDNYDEIYYSD